MASTSPLRPPPVLASRFELLRLLGRGGCGEVFEALDRRRGGHVALKTLPAVEPGALYRFKQEFRALADVSHRNLVRLHELVADGAAWFFTMELIEGHDLVEHLRQGPGSSRQALAETMAAAQQAQTMDAALRATAPAGGAGLGEGPGAVVARPRRPLGVDARRVQGAMRQLVEGVMALHEAGKLHRDLKPSNVLVGRDERVVVLDFGLAADLRLVDQGLTEIQSLTGTPAYMSPEQVRGGRLGPAADWYAVGVILFEALTGGLPFEGPPLSVLVRKQEEDAPAVGELVEGVPAELERLCGALLARAPGDRPDGEQILRALSGVRAPTARRHELFVGREGELGELKQGLAGATGGAVVCVEGASGMGKTALVQRFAEWARREAGAVVLEGRCYEHESVPYKAIDPLIDAATRELLRPGVEAGPAPADMALLARLFPVLRRVPSVAALPAPALPLDPHQLRARAFEALRGLLGALARRGPLALIIDDLQWGDAESAVLLHELLVSEAPLPALVVLAYRPDEIERSAPLRMLLGAGPLRLPAGRREVALGPLGADEAARLCGALLSPGTPIEPLVREAGGSPLLLVELCRSSGQAAGLGALVAERRSRLDAAAAALLGAAALGASPLPSALLFEAAGLDQEAGQQALDALRAERMVRATRQLSGPELIEIRHDRLRELIAASIPGGEARTLHRRLAEALGRAERPDPERLLRHWREAGETDRAAVCALAAARRADEALAFDRAARLHRDAIALLPPGEAAPLWRPLAEALASAGRGPEAAEAFREAAARAPAAEAHDLSWRAAAALLRAGHRDEGLASMRQGLLRAGLPYPSGALSALVRLLACRLAIVWAAWRWRERPVESVDREALARLDLCWSAAIGLSGDPLPAALYGARHLLLALRAGAACRLGRALALEALGLAMRGAPADRVARTLGQARALARRSGFAYLLGLTEGMSGMVRYLGGRWSSGRRRLEAAERQLSDGCSGVAWELDIVRLFGLECLAYEGDLGALARRVPPAVREAEARGDRLAATMLRSGIQNLAWLALDEPDEALRQIEAAEAEWPAEGFHVQHFLHLYARVQHGLYVGDGLAALARLRRAWPRMRRSLLLALPFVRVSAHHLRGRAALAAAHAASPAQRPRLLASARRDARWLARAASPWARALGLGLLAAVAAAEGDRERAASGMRQAREAFERAGMGLHADVCALRLAGLQGEPRALEQAQASLRARGARAPGRLAAVLLPG